MTRRAETPPAGASAPLRLVLVDDEEPARLLLREYLDSMPGVEIVAECANGFEAVKAVAEHDPDLLLLDIQMPGLDGFEVLELLEREIPVIFITAYDEFALRAFEIHALDYLLKPVRRERLAEALSRARERAATLPAPPARGRSQAPRIPQGLGAETQAVVRTAQRRRQPLERILVTDAGKVTVIPVARVAYLEAQDDYVCVVADGKKHLKLQTLNELEGLLDPNRFVRIHRSFLVNLEHLERIERYARDSRIAIVKDGAHLPVSRAGYARLRKLM